MKLHMINLIIGCTVLLSCCPPWQSCGDRPPENQDSTKYGDLPYEVKWQVPLFEDTLYSITAYFKPIVFEDLVIFSRRKGPSFNIELVAYDKRSGEVRWEWTEEVRNLVFTDDPIVLHDTLVVVSGSQIYLIDMRTGRTIAEINEEIDTNFVPLPAISYYGGRIYQSYEREFKDSLTYVRSVDLKTFRWRTEVIDYTTYPGDRLSVYPPSIWINDHGDTIFVCLKRIYNYKDWRRDRANLISYNITADTLMWERDSLDYVGWSTESPRVEGDRIYFFGARHIECINKHTGETLWKTVVVDDKGAILGNLPVYTEDTIFINTTTSYIVAIDKESGRRLYYREVSGNGSYLTLYKGKLYRSFIYMDVIDAKSGRVLLTIKKSHNYSRKTPGKWSDGVVIDPETELMYVEDGFFAMCLTLPEVE